MIPYAKYHIIHLYSTEHMESYPFYIERQTAYTWRLYITSSILVIHMTPLVGCYANQNYSILLAYIHIPRYNGRKTQDFGRSL